MNYHTVFLCNILADTRMTPELKDLTPHDTCVNFALYMWQTSRPIFFELTQDKTIYHKYLHND
jgi:hypothetical protein